MMMRSDLTAMMGRVAVLGLMMAGMAPVWADDLLVVAPMRIVLQDGHPTEVMSVGNKSEVTRSYKIILEDQVMDPNGNLVSAETFPYSAKRMVRFMPREVTLAPGQRQTIRVMAMLPNELPAGDYHTHMIFDEQLPQQQQPSGTVPNLKVAMETIYSVGVPVTIRHGDTSGTLSLKSASLLTDPRGRPVIGVTLGRSGNREMEGDINVVDGAGKRVADSRHVRVYREADSVSLQLTVPGPMDMKKLAAMHLTADLNQSGGIPQQALPVMAGK